MIALRPRPYVIVDRVLGRLAFVFPFDGEPGREAHAGGHVHQFVDGEFVDVATHEITDPWSGHAQSLRRFLLGDLLTHNVLLKLHHQLRAKLEVFRFGGGGCNGIPDVVKALCFHPCSSPVRSSQRAEPRLCQGAVLFRRPPRLLLEDMEHIDRLVNACDVDAAVDIAFVADVDLPHACADARHRFPVVRIQTGFNAIDLIAQFPLDALWKGTEIVKGSTKKYRVFHGEDCIKFDTLCQT